MLALLRVRQARENPAEFDERSPVDVAGECSLSQTLFRSAFDSAAKMVRQIARQRSAAERADTAASSAEAVRVSPSAMAGNAFREAEANDLVVDAKNRREGH